MLSLFNITKDMVHFYVVVQSGGKSSIRRYKVTVFAVVDIAETSPFETAGSSCSPDITQQASVAPSWHAG